MASPWTFGNTTVRNPLRIRSGLSALNESTLNGYLIGAVQEKKFAELLERAGVIEIKNRTRDYSDMGRKWRSCFSQLGFITHKFCRNTQLGETEQKIIQTIEHMKSKGLTGLPYEITPNGKRLVAADSVPQQQECMLRALLAYEIPSAIEKNNGTHPFKPIFFVLYIVRELLKKTGIGISDAEMGILQTFRMHDANEINNVIHLLEGYREKYDTAQGTVAKRAITRKILAPLAQKSGIQYGSLCDYADSNFRYLRYTGLFSYKGRRLTFNEDKLPIINAILDIGVDSASDDDYVYLARIWDGASLPTDHEAYALSEIKRYKHLLISRGISEVHLPPLPTEPSLADLSQIRLHLEEVYRNQLENKYASVQGEEPYLSEIIAYLKKLDNQKDDEAKSIDSIDDKAVYLEWAVWRAFLAINSLVNPAYEARRFRVDQDFYPISCAPGRGPDMIFVFEEYALVVEVTLTSSSRQEAAEGEPVRRHVAVEKARIAAKYRKPVYGLFLAGVIDNNTAETFRIGVWYDADKPEFINIVPLTLGQFIKLMNLFRREKFSVHKLRQLLDTCLITRNAHAPAWKKEIEEAVADFIGFP